MASNGKPTNKHTFGSCHKCVLRIEESLWKIHEIDFYCRPMGDNGRKLSQHGVTKLQSICEFPMLYKHTFVQQSLFEFRRKICLFLNYLMVFSVLFFTFID